MNKFVQMSKVVTGSLAAAGASILSAASALAAMPGPALTADVITGVKAGVADSVDTLETTINNQYLGELALMFIGFAAVVGLLMYLVKGHRRI